MRLTDIQNTNVLARPLEKKTTVEEGSYYGQITKADLVEKPSQYETDNSMVSLTMKVRVKNEDGEPIELFISVNYNWSPRSKMHQLLEQLNVLPEPGECISLTDLEGMQVRVTVENVKKDKTLYSNIVSMRPQKTNEKPSKRKSIYTREESVPTKKRRKREEKHEEYEEDIDIDDIEDEYEDYETGDEGEDEYEYEDDEDDYDPLDDL